MKNKKILAMLITVTMLAISQTIILPVQTTVVQARSQEMCNIRLKDIVVNSDYKKSEVLLARKTEENITTVKVIDKSSGMLIEEMSEKIELSRTSRNGIATSHSADENYTIHTLTRKREDGPIETMLELRLSMYSKGSFRQINKVLGKKIFASGSSDTTLEDGSVSCESVTGKFPCVSLNYAGSGVITGTTTKSTTGEFSVKFLESCGFSVSAETSKTYFYRKPVKITGTYNLY